MKNEATDKTIYHKVMSACTRRTDDLEKLARSGSGSTPSAAPRSIYDPFQKVASSPHFSQSNGSTVTELNPRLDSLDGSIHLLKGVDTRE